MVWKRRDFLRATLGSSTLLALGGSVPAFLGRSALAAPKATAPGAKQTVLVVIEMTGGNDGLNTVIPFADDAYAKARPTLRQPAARVKKINDYLGLHPAMDGFAKLLQDGRLAVVQGVGYPNPSRSHFRSMDIWQTGSLAEDATQGWLGGALGGFAAAGTEAGGFHIGGGELPLALTGPGPKVPSLQSLADYQLRTSPGGGDDATRRRIIEQQAARSAAGEAASGDLLGFVQRSALATYASAARLREFAREYNTPVFYPGSGLASRLKLVAQLIHADLPARIYYVSQTGYDTHSEQGPTHARLLEELSGSVTAFHEDLKHHGQAGRVVTMTFSEFGRRVQENGSKGTDHGSGAPMFFAGEAVRSGPIGKHPSLTDLEDGDLKFHTDFRRVYASVLDRWLGVESQKVLGAKFEAIELFKRRGLL